MKQFTLNYPNQNLVIGSFVIMINSIGFGFGISVDEFQWRYSHPEFKVSLVSFSVRFLCFTLSFSIPLSFPPKEIA